MTDVLDQLLRISVAHVGHTADVAGEPVIQDANVRACSFLCLSVKILVNDLGYQNWKCKRLIYPSLSHIHTLVLAFGVEVRNTWNQIAEAAIKIPWKYVWRIHSVWKKKSNSFVFAMKIFL